MEQSLRYAGTFLKIKRSYKKTIPHLNGAPEFMERDFDQLQLILDCLSPIKLATEAISARDATLLTADASLTWALSKINRSFDFGEALYCSLLKQAFDRRSKLSGVLQIVHNNGSNILHDIFVNATEQSVITFVSKCVGVEDKEMNDCEIEESLDNGSQSLKDLLKEMVSNHKLPLLTRPRMSIAEEIKHEL